jgi:hypothetical protein
VTLDAFQTTAQFGQFQDVSRDRHRQTDGRSSTCPSRKPQVRGAPELLILTNVTGGYGLGWERRRVLISGGGPPTSLGWQHLTADRASAAFD